MSQTTQKAKLLKWMRNSARRLKKPYEDRPEDFEDDSAAYLLEWAAELISKYAPADLPQKRLRRKK